MTNTTNTSKEEQMKALELAIVSIKDPTHFIDMLALNHYLAGQCGNKVPVDSARNMFKKWLSRHQSSYINEVLDRLESKSIEYVDGTETIDIKCIEAERKIIKEGL